MTPGPSRVCPAFSPRRGRRCGRRKGTKRDGGRNSSRLRRSATKLCGCAQTPPIPTPSSSATRLIREKRTSPPVSTDGCPAHNARGRPSPVAATTRGIASAFLFGILLTCPPSSFGEVCDGGQATADAADPLDRENACQGAAEAIAFLRSQGLKTDLPLTIRVEELSYPCDASVLAHYRPGRHVVEVLSIHACRVVAPNGRILGLEINDELYQSLVAHMVAHFIADQGFLVERPSRAAREYIASTVQIGTLPRRCATRCWQAGGCRDSGTMPRSALFTTPWIPKPSRSRPGAISPAPGTVRPSISACLMAAFAGRAAGVLEMPSINPTF